MKTKSYKIQVTDNADGTSTVKRENVGFSAIELIGLLEATKASIIQEIRANKRKRGSLCKEKVKELKSKIK